jgi:hypothetical protein
MQDTSSPADLRRGGVRRKMSMVLSIDASMVVISDMATT